MVEHYETDMAKICKIHIWGLCRYLKLGFELKQWESSYQCSREGSKKQLKLAVLKLDPSSNKHGLKITTILGFLFIFSSPIIYASPSQPQKSPRSENFIEQISKLHLNAISRIYDAETI